MKIKTITSEEEYKKAVWYLEELGDRPDFEDNEDLIEEFEFIADLVQKYDSIHYPVKTITDPIELIKIAMEYRDLKQKDLYHIASKGVISEIFNKKRAMSKRIIREFSKFFLLDQETLNVKYELKKSAKKAKPKQTIKSYFNFDAKIKTSTNNFQTKITNYGLLLNILAKS